MQPDYTWKQAGDWQVLTNGHEILECQHSSGRRANASKWQDGAGQRWWRLAWRDTGQPAGELTEEAINAGA